MHSGLRHFGIFLSGIGGTCGGGPCGGSGIIGGNHHPGGGAAGGTGEKGNEAASDFAAWRRNSAKASLPRADNINNRNKTRCDVI